jgi:putative transposase
MPRRWRVDGQICHVYNRAAAKLAFMRNADDYRAFLRILASSKAQTKDRIKLFGYCLMPNHWHFIICPATTHDMSQFMRHLTRRHALSFLRANPERSGAVYQGRFGCVPVQDDHHLRTALLYVDRNPFRAKLVPSAEAWLWSSALHHVGEVDDPLLDPLPQGLFRDWLTDVNRVDPSDALVRSSVRRGLPIGDDQWRARLSEDWRQRLKPRRGAPRNPVETDGAEAQAAPEPGTMNRER